jgi:magnesium-transporting ATPase (P-type)
MEEHPYQTPKSKVVDVEKKPGSAAKAITVGIVLNSVFSLLAPIALAFIFGFVLSAQGYSSEEIQDYIRAEGFNNAYSILSLIMGLVITLISAYIVGVISRQKVYRNATIMVLIIYIAVVAIQWNDVGKLLEASIYLGLDLLFAWAGAWLYQRGVGEGCGGSITNRS